MTRRDDAPTLRQLRYLSVLSRTRHYRRAAELCGVSQPSLSAQISTLEDTLGARLVERGRSGVALTPLGREVVTRAQNALDAVQGIVDLARTSKDGFVGAIRLGVSPTLGPYLLPRAVARLHREHPDLKLYVREGSPRALIDELAVGAHDLVLGQIGDTGAEFGRRALFREPLLLAMAEDDPLAEMETVPVEALRGRTVLLLSRDYRLHDQVRALCESIGARAQIDYEGTSLDALRQMTGMGMGLCFLPMMYARSEIPADGEVVVRPLKGRRIDREASLVWRAAGGESALYDRLSDVIVSAATEAMRSER